MQVSEQPLLNDLEDENQLIPQSAQNDEGLAFSLNRTETDATQLDDEDFYVRQGADRSTDEEDDDENHEDGGLSEISNEMTYFEKKVGYQRRALFRKNMALQWQQKWTNLCQIMVPVFGLAIVLLVENLGGLIMEGTVDKVIYVPFPYVYSLDYKTIASVVGFFNVTDCNQWYMYDFDKDLPQSEREFFGHNYGRPMYWPDSAGMLSNQNVRSFACPEVDYTVPYFKEFNAQDYPNYPDTNSYLYDTLERVSNIKMKVDVKDVDAEELANLPDGVVTVQEANESKLKYKIQINDGRYWQYHRNNGISKIGYYDTEVNDTKYLYRVHEGLVNFADVVNQAYMKELFPEVTVVSGIGLFPFEFDWQNNLARTVSIMGALVFPICLCMGLPVFIYNIVLEKEARLIENMKINGMRMSNYWLVNYLFSLVLYCVTMVTFVFFGDRVFQFQFFQHTSIPLILLILFGWGLAQISLAIFLSVFIQKSQSASVIGYSLSIWLMTIASVLNLTVYSPPMTMDWFLYFFPTFTFCRSIYLLCLQCAYYNCVGSIAYIPSECINTILFLYLSALVYMALAMYLYQVVPQTYGVAKPWNFCCRDFQRKRKNKKIRDTDEIGDLEEQHSDHNQRPIFDFDLNLEDQDSKAERNIVYNLDKADYYKYPLIVKDLRKVYPGFGGRPPKAATKSFCLRIRKGEMFGMLGPNGAGKTTLISILTGLYKPNSGNAWVAGYDIKDQLEVVQLQIGVCPQFDILWNDLTVEDHLYFYARLKGVSPDNEDANVTRAIEEVLLQKFRHFQVKQLSGGMKRRLSVAISLVSEPKIIFLDEPSTGLDPENRRQLWDILSMCKGKRAVVITTHSMEEADVLCNRIGIVSDGILRCVGPQVRLKSQYGGGYHLFLNSQRGKVLSVLKAANKRSKRKKMQLEMDKKKKAKDNEIIQHPSHRINSLIEEVNQEEETQDECSGEDLDINQVHKNITDFVATLLPQSILISEFNGSFVYQIPLEGFDAENLFEEFEKNKEQLRITDWGLSQCSLEDVFARICAH